MKPDIHPEYHPVIFVDGDAEFITRSTLTSAKTREVDGVEHYVIDVDISSATHPFWTGQQRIVDSAGRVERFARKYGRDSFLDKGKKESAPDESAADESAEDTSTEETSADAEEASEAQGADDES